MRSTWPLALLALIALGLIVAKNGAATSRRPNTGNLEYHAGEGGGRFVVHEWGTFTSFSGSDSLKLEFRPLVDADLPRFVLNRPRQSGLINPFSKGDFEVLQRMETPVTYFYTDRPRQAKVRVDFPQGLLTEFFPPVEKMEPPFDKYLPDKVSRSALDWGQVFLIPTDRLQPDIANPELGKQLGAHIVDKLLPAGDRDDHYALARDTDSALIYVERPADAKRPFSPQGKYFEKFLFYRGVGNFELPLQLSAQADGRFELRNVGHDPVRSLFLVTVEGNELRFQEYAEIRTGQRLTMVQSARTASVDELCEAVTAALVAEKLYLKEARAMVNTWRSSWFGEPGTRLFYLLPTDLTTEILPLTVEPKPDEVVRVMVGRLEIMRPADEERIGAMVKQSAKVRAHAQNLAVERGETFNYDLPQQIIDLGRLAEPALVRIKVLTKDPQVRSEAEILLAQVQQYREALAQATSAGN